MVNPNTPLKGLSQDEIVDLASQNEDVYFEYCDENYVKSLEINILNHLNTYYFRSRFIGFDENHERNNPDRPLIYIGNHSGMAFPWDAMMLGAGLFKMNNHSFTGTMRPLSAPMLSMSTLMNPFLIPNFWKRVGGIDATSLNFETLMHFNHSNVLMYPEGVPGIGKGFHRKYQLQRFSTSFIRMSLKYRTDVIPILTVNGEYINPYSYTFNWIDNLAQKMGVPFLPISFILPFLLLQPWLFYFAFPARLTYVMGKRVKPYEMIDKPFEELTENDIADIRDQVQASMQADLNDAVELYGKEPFKLGDLILNNLRNLSRIPFFSSPGWPLVFAEHERLYKQNNGEPVEMNIGFFSLLGILFRNPFYISFFIPILGWIPILLKGYAGNKLTGEQKVRKI